MTRGVCGEFQQVEGDGCQIHTSEGKLQKQIAKTNVGLLRKVRVLPGCVSELLLDNPQKTGPLADSRRSVEELAASPPYTVTRFQPFDPPRIVLVV